MAKEVNTEEPTPYETVDYVGPIDHHYCPLSEKETGQHNPRESRETIRPYCDHNRESAEDY